MLWQVFIDGHDLSCINYKQAIIAGGVGAAGVGLLKIFSKARKLYRLSRASRKADELVDLFRAVGPDELADIRNTGLFRPSPYGSEGKFFTTSGRQAARYAKEAVTNFGDESYTIVRTQAPRTLIESKNASAIVEKGIKAYVIPNESLPNLVPRILNNSPIP